MVPASKRYLFSMSLMLLLAFFTIGVSQARAENASDIPLLHGLVIDGNPADWGDRGFQVGILTNDEGAVRPVDNLEVALRLGWNEEGLLVLVAVRDNGAAEQGEIWMGDSVELFIGSNASGSSYYQFIASPGRDPAQPSVRVLPWDYRSDKSRPLTSTVKVSATDAGYTVEALLPWAPFPLQPTLGQEIAFQIFVNDLDAGGERFQVVWQPRDREGAASRASHILRLAENPSTPVQVTARAFYERFRRIQVDVLAASELTGKTVSICEGNACLANAKLETRDGRSSATLTAPLPEQGGARELELHVDGEPLTTLSLPDLAEQRARALLEMPFNFRPYLIFSEQFPICDFDQPNLAEDMLGRYTIKTSFYNANYEPVTIAKDPGRYGAVVEVIPEHGRGITFFRTLFRMPAEPGIDFWWPRNAPLVVEMPKAPWINDAVAAEQSGAVNDIFWAAFLRSLDRDPNCAALMAKLFEGNAIGSKPSIQDDLLAQDRQWWVSLKRKLYGLEEQYLTPFVCPRPIEGKPAPALHDGTAVEAGMKPEAAEKIDTVLQQWAADTDEGFAVCVARHGVIILHKAYGQRDGRPMTLTDKSWMASITKLLSATLLMTLVDQNRISLDDPVDKYLPSFREVEVKKPLTIRHLYTHTNGLWGHWGDELHDFDQLIGSYYPYLRVGEQFSYNGAGFALGGKIIELTSGEALPLFYKHHLLEPLGCENTEVFGTSWDARSAALDIAKVGQLLLNRGAYGDKRFFSEATFQQMLPEKLTKVLGPNTTDERGIGIHSWEGDGAGKGTFGHGAASSATLRIDPENDLVIVMTRNSAGKNFDKYHPLFLKAVGEGIAR